MAKVRPSNKRGAGLTESVVFAHKPAGDYRYRQGMGMLPSQEYRYYFNDFGDLVTANAVIGTTVVKTTNGTLVSGTTTDNGGLVRVSGVAASDGAVNYFPKSVVLSGTRFFMEARVRISSVSQDLYIGLSSLTATTNPNDVYTTSADSLAAFGILDGGAGLPNLIYDKANSGPQTDNAASSLINNSAIPIPLNTFVTIGLFYNGAVTASAGGGLIGYVNGSPVVISSNSAKIPDNVLLAPFFGGRCGAGGVTTQDWDYIRWSQDR